MKGKNTGIRVFRDVTKERQYRQVERPAPHFWGVEYKTRNLGGKIIWDTLPMLEFHTKKSAQKWVDEHRKEIIEMAEKEIKERK